VASRYRGRRLKGKTAKIYKTTIAIYVLLNYPVKELIVNPSPATPPLSEAQQIEQLKKQLAWAEWKISALEERLRLELIRKYGPKSETLSDAQLLLLEMEPGVSSAEVEAESRREPLPEVSPVVATSPKKSRPHPGRQELPANLPRVERILACTPEQCVCQCCGKQTVVIGYEQSEQLDVEPARFFVVVTKREKRACKGCAEGVKTAALPARIIDKGLVSDRVVIDTLVSKYCDHLPLYRQSAILERETGVTISRATMDGWVMTVGGLLEPIKAAMGRELIDGGYIQADETPVPVQMHDKRGKSHQAYLWQYGRPKGSVVFDFRMGRGREGPKEFLGRFQGILGQTGPLGKKCTLSALDDQALGGGASEGLELAPGRCRAFPVVGAGYRYVLPAQWRDVRKVDRGDWYPFLFEGLKSQIQIHGVPQDDGGHDQIQCHGAEVLVQLRPIADPAPAVETDGPFEGMMGFAFVQPHRHSPAQFGIL
jgi:transposase